MPAYASPHLQWALRGEMLDFLAHRPLQDEQFVWAEVRLGHECSPDDATMIDLNFWNQKIEQQSPFWRVWPNLKRSRCRGDFNLPVWLSPGGVGSASNKWYLNELFHRELTLIMHHCTDRTRFVVMKRIAPKSLVVQMKTQYIKSLHEIHVRFKYLMSGNDVLEKDGNPFVQKWSCLSRLTMKLLTNAAKRELVNTGVMKPIDDIHVWANQCKVMRSSHVIWDPRWKIPVVHRGPISGKVLAHRLKKKTPESQLLLTHYFRRVQ